MNPNNSKSRTLNRGNQDPSPHVEDPHSEVRRFDSPTKRYRRERDEMDGFGVKAKREVNPTQAQETCAHDTEVEK
jgi:hypothetical protein